MSAEAAKATWNATARGWDACFDWYRRNVQPLTDWFCDTIGMSGARVLDLASGTGQPALALARRVLPGGRVVATDLSSDMLRILDRRAREGGIDNIEVVAMDAQELRFEANAFDAVSCACGLMFCPDPVAVVREVRRVLAPAGRFAIAVWDEPSRNPFFTVTARALAASSPAKPADPNAPGPFRLGRPGELERVLCAGGLTDIAIETCSMTFALESLEEYWTVFTRCAAGVAEKVAALSAHERTRAREALFDGANAYFRNGRLLLPATALCASGRSP